MAGFPTFNDLFRIARDEMLARNGQLSQAAVEREGSDANIMVAGGVAAADEVVGQLTRIEAALYLDSAKDEKLDRLVYDRYQMKRKPAAVAQGSVYFTTTAPAAGSFTISSGTLVQTADGIQFQTTQDAVFSIGSVGPVIVPVVSILAGSGQQAKIGTITSIVSQITNSAADLAVTNPAATAGAADRESNDALRDRARRFFTSVRKATAAALVQGALAIPGVVTAEVFESLDAQGRPARYVQLIITDQFTDQLVDYTVVPPRYQTQAQTLAATVFAGLSDVRAAGIYVDVLVAQVILQAIQLSLTFVAGADAVTAAQQARAAVVNYVNSLNPGSPFDPAAAVAALRVVPGLLVTGAEIVSPAGVVVALPLEVIRTSMNLVTAALAD